MLHRGRSCVVLSVRTGVSWQQSRNRPNANGPYPREKAKLLYMHTLWYFYTEYYFSRSCVIRPFESFQSWSGQNNSVALAGDPHTACKRHDDALLCSALLFCCFERPSSCLPPSYAGTRIALDLELGARLTVLPSVRFCPFFSCCCRPEHVVNTFNPTPTLTLTPTSRSKPVHRGRGR